MQHTILKYIFNINEKKVIMDAYVTHLVSLYCLTEKTDRL